MKCYGIMMDTHRPFHNRKAYALQLEVFKDLNVDGLYIIGDYADFYYVNGHGPKHPGMSKDLVKEIEDVNSGLDELDKYFAKKPKVFIEGNHEYRLERFLWNKAPEIFGFLDVKHLLKIDQRPHWRWVPYGPNQKARVGDSKLWIRHEPPPGPNVSIPKNVGGNLVYGHTHRIFETHHVTLKGENHVAFSCGWMGDLRQNLVYGYVRGHHLWQLGFGLVWVDEKTGLFYHQKIQVQTKGGYTACVNGKLYRA